MGVRGLAKFVYSREEFLLKPYKLSNTTLIIDGNNVCSYMFSTSQECKRGSIFGGDYDIFYSSVKKFFDNLLICGVTPIVLFDGCQSESKFKTIKGRREGKLQDLRNLTENKWFPIISPLFLFEVFVEVLVDLRIEYVQLYEEADREIAAFAKYFNCPVLSDDSDFFIFDIDFVPLSKMEFTVQRGEDGTLFVPCSLFQSDNLLKEFPGLQKPLLPFISILLGNDYTGSYIHKFIKAKSDDIVVDVFRRLQFSEGIASLTDEILESSGENDIIAGEMAIERALKYYDTPLPIWLSKVNVGNGVRWNVIPMVHGLDLSKLPKKFFEHYEKCKLRTFILGMIRSKFYSLSVQVEDLNENSAHLPSLPIIRAISRLLGTFASSSEDITLNIRVKGVLSDMKVICRDEEHVPSRLMENILNESEGVRRQVFCDSLSMTVADRLLLRKFDKDWTLFVISVIYWIRNTCKVSKVNVSAVVLMALCNYVKCADRFERRDKEKAGEPPSFSHLLRLVPHEECTKFVDECHKLKVNGGKIVRRRYFFRTIHKFASLQSLMLHILQYNSLLGEPFPELRVSRFYSGTALLTFYVLCLEKKEDVMSVMKDLPRLLEAYTFLDKCFSCYFVPAAKQNISK